MSNIPNPGLAQQGSTRIILRIVGGVLTLGGLGLILFSIFSMGNSFTSHTVPTNPEDVDGFVNGIYDQVGGTFGTMGFIFVGTLMLVIGSACLRAGFLGTTTRYIAGETMPVVKDSAAYLTDGEGFMGIGKVTPGATANPSSGVFCSKCGTHNDAGAHYCDSCGSALAQ
jgi:hypothetical protein